MQCPMRKILKFSYFFETFHIAADAKVFAVIICFVILSGRKKTEFRPDYSCVFFVHQCSLASQRWQIRRNIH